MLFVCLLLFVLASTLKLAVVKCDCDTEEGNMASNMFTNDTVDSGGNDLSLSLFLISFFVVPFKTVKGKKVVNIIVKGDEKANSLIKVVKILVKV